MRLLTVFELRVLGARLALQSVVVQGDQARLKFRVDAKPRMAGLNLALDEVQFAADVRRVQPLTLRLTRLGGLPMTAGLIRAFHSVLAASAPDSASVTAET